MLLCLRHPGPSGSGRSAFSPTQGVYILLMLQESRISGHPEPDGPGWRRQSNTRGVGEDIVQGYDVVMASEPHHGISLVGSGDPIIHMWIIFANDVVVQA